MSDIDTQDDLVIPDELETLKARATQLGVNFHPSIKVEALREKVAKALGTDKPDEAKVAPAVATVLSQRQEALKLIRVRLTCMNPAKKDWDGEIITVGNSVIGSVKKFVPFTGTEEGYHLPKVIYDMLADRQCQVFTTIKDNNGNNIRRGKLIKEFAIEVLPSLTADELAELARRQAMSGSVE